MEPITAGLIAAGATLTSSATNAYAQGRMNKKTREWNEKMYNLQNKRDLDNWNLQNEYNSPQKQMERLTQAGLNPNLVYGNGATTTAGSVDSSNAPAWNPRAPEIDLAPASRDGLAAYFDVQTKSAQLDNLKAQNTVLVQEAALKAATTAGTTASTAKSSFELGQAQRLADISAEAAAENLRSLQIGNTFQLSENERRQATTASTLSEAAERILKSRSDRATSTEQRALIQSQIKDLRESTELKQIDKSLREKGINPHDPMWIRILGQAMERLFKAENWLGKKPLEMLKK